jgi:3-deoxy-D-arabino-heptulosonate 7-phosphate (DAHP) synthase
LTVTGLPGPDLLDVDVEYLAVGRDGEHVLTAELRRVLVVVGGCHIDSLRQVVDLARR